VRQHYCKQTVLVQLIVDDVVTCFVLEHSRLLVIPVLLVFSEFLLVSAQRSSKDGGVRIFAPKMDVLSLQKFGGPIFMGYHH